MDGKIKNEVLWKKSGDSGLVTTSQMKSNKLEPKKLGEVNSIIQYLENYHGLEGLFPWIAPETVDFFESREITDPEPVQLMVETLGLEYAPWYSYSTDSTEVTSVYTEFFIEKNTPLEIVGYEQLIEFVVFPSYENGQIQELIEGPSYSLSKPVTIEENLTFTWQGVEINLQSAEFIKKLGKQQGLGVQKELPQEEMTVIISKDSLEIKVVYRKLAFTKIQEHAASFGQLSGTLMIRKIGASVP